MEGTLTWTSIRGLIRRRWRIFLLVSAPIAVAAVPTAFLLPPTYRASATVLIEGQQIPREFVTTTVTSYVEERIQQITQQVLSRPTLLDIIQRFDLYSDERKRDPLDQIIATMRKAIDLKMVSANVKTGRSATVAFTVSYEGENPGTVQKVTDTLASLYLKENLETRGKRASGTTAFLQEELDGLRAQIEELQAKIGAFKRSHPGELPEHNALNLQAFERAQRDFDNLTTQLHAAQERKVYLQGQIATLDPLAPGDAAPDSLDPRRRLHELRVKLTRLRGTISEDHPDVRTVKREIRDLEAQLGPVADSGERKVQLSALKEALAKKQRELGPKHPDVVGLAKQVEAAEKEAEAQAESSKSLETANPAYVNLKTQIGSTELEIKSLSEQRRRSEEKIREYERKMTRAPASEQEYMRLTQDYQSAQRKYEEFLSKLTEAKVSQGMEESQRGERFTLIDPAGYPERPYKPNRLAVSLIGIALALGAGVAAAAARENFDTTLKSPAEVQTVAGLPVLVVLPFIPEEDAPKHGKAALIAAALAAVLIAAAALAVHLLVAPLDVMWFRILRRLG